MSDALSVERPTTDRQRIAQYSFVHTRHADRIGSVGVLVNDLEVSEMVLLLRLGRLVPSP
jgi:hypothetical protein